MYIKIELLSDMCPSSGETFNCTIDSDVCYDKYGLPYLPAKRIKGCLREAGMELTDWNVDIDVDRLFGLPGNKNAMLEISNGKLKDYNEYVSDILNIDETALTHPQNILNCFTYIRNQTAIEKNGVAKDTSLRKTRVLKAGLIFYAHITIEKENNDVADKLEKCCQALKLMGLNRTRGMGQVKLELVKDEQSTGADKRTFTYNGRKNRLSYTITLKAPLLTKSVSAGQSMRDTYIEGSKILGLLAHHVGMNYENFMALGGMEKGSEFICSNAYISSDGKRYLPVSASLYSVKGKDGEHRNKAVEMDNQTEYVNEQLLSEKDFYVENNEDGNANKLSVDTEIHYHHARPKDKSIGRANSKDLDANKRGEFYQLESLSEGQQFSGYVLGNEEQIRKVEKYIIKNPVFRMGYNRSAEYGEVTLKIDNIKEEQIDEEQEKIEKFILKLEAPMIQYNENGMYSTDCRIIQSELESILKTKIEFTKKFIKYKEICGWNTTWKCRRPTIFAFDKGTTFVVKTENRVDISKLSGIRMGERVSEGYGEITAFPVPKKYALKLQEPESSKMTVDSNYVCKKEDMIPFLVNKKCKEKVMEYACENITKIINLKEPKNMSVIYAMHEILKNTKQILEFKSCVKKLFEGKSDNKNAKCNIANSILESPNAKQLKRCNLYSDYFNDIPDELLYTWYYNAFLSQAKYMIKKGEK